MAIVHSAREDLPQHFSAYILGCLLSNSSGRQLGMQLRSTCVAYLCGARRLRKCTIQRFVLGKGSYKSIKQGNPDVGTTTQSTNNGYSSSRWNSSPAANYWPEFTQATKHTTASS